MLYGIPAHSCEIHYPKCKGKTWGMASTPLTLPISRRRSLWLESVSRMSSISNTPRESDSKGRSLEKSRILEIASTRTSSDLESFLCSNPADVHLRDSSGLTVMMHIVSKPWDADRVIELCGVLLNHGADLNEPDAEGYTTCHWASACGHKSALDYILSHPEADPLARGHDGDTPLHRACRLGRTDNIVVILTRWPHFIREVNLALHTPLEVAGVWLAHVNVATREKVRLAIAGISPSTRTLVLHHDDCLLHLPRMNGSQGDQPWESPERVLSIMSGVRRSQAVRQDPLLFVSTDFPPATDSQILRCHSQEYLRFLYSLEELVEDTPIPLTPAVQQRLGPLTRTKSNSLSDTSYSSGTLAAARRACGAVCHAASEVLSGSARNAFCVVRPPSHHCGFDGPLVDSCSGSCGFSILNAVMVAAMDVIATRGKRVAIVDLDVHHGNGTEDIVRQLARPEDILFVSIHMFDNSFYPASGRKSDFARNIHNVPVQPLWQDEAAGRLVWLAAVEEKVVPLLASFRPDLVLISAGFDGASGDVGNCRHRKGEFSQVGMDLSPADFAAATESVVRIANSVCAGKVVSVLEGGYGKVQWVESRVSRTDSDASTRASEDADCLSPGSLRNGRKRNRPSATLTQVINRQPLAAAALQHVRALLALT